MLFTAKFQRVQNFACVASRHLSRRLKINHQYEGKHLREEEKTNGVIERKLN